MREADTICRADLSEKILYGEKESKLKVVNIPDDGYPLEQLEREVVIEALERKRWNRSSAAKFLKIPRHILIYRMEKYGIIPPEKG